MRVLHLITSLRTGGAEKLMVDLLPRLRKEGIEVEICLHDGVETQFRKELEAKGIKVHDLGVGGSVYSPLKLLKFLPKAKNYDIIHTHNTASQIFGAIASFFTKAKMVTTEHNTSNRRRAHKIFRRIDRWMYNRYSNVICISQKAEDNLREFIGKSKAKICTINNGIDLEKIRNAEPSSLLEEKAPGSKKIIMVAAFRHEKDQPTLIRAMKYLPDEFHLFLVGDGSRRMEFEELINQEKLNERVHLLGIRNDVPSLLKAAEYIVMSSHYEGLSLSSVEGLASGNPVLASDVDGLREVIQGEGVLFEHENSEELAECILEIDKNKDLKKKISDSCLNTSSQYDIDLMRDKYLNIYKSI